MLIGAKLTKLQEKHIHMPHHGLDLEIVTIFFPYKIFCKWQWGLDWNDINSKDSQMEESWNSQVMNPIILQVHNSFIWTLIQRLSKTKL
jgi:hypothetical protein